MSKPFIRLRKKLWLPIKYKLLRQDYINEMNVRPRTEIWDRLQMEKAALIKAKTGLDNSEVARCETIINTLEWVSLKQEE